jgi:hypothetical protein
MATASHCREWWLDKQYLYELVYLILINNQSAGFMRNTGEGFSSEECQGGMDDPDFATAWPRGSGGRR